MSPVRFRDVATGTQRSKVVLSGPAFARGQGLPVCTPRICPHCQLLPRFNLRLPFGTPLSLFQVLSLLPQCLCLWVLGKVSVPLCALMCECRVPSDGFVPTSTSCDHIFLGCRGTTTQALDQSAESQGGSPGGEWKAEPNQNLLCAHSPL